MSYSEKDGQVILTMSRKDYDLVMRLLGAGSARDIERVDSLHYILGLLNRLNEGNPDCTAYLVGSLEQLEAEENPFEPPETREQQDRRVGRMIRENADKRMGR
jgi:hypothetical protein